jgi:hypothetical protein
MLIVPDAAGTLHFLVKMQSDRWLEHEIEMDEIHQQCEPIG